MANDVPSPAPEDPNGARGMSQGPEGGGPWVPDLASLTGTGQISERVLANIPWNSVGDQAGSWLDPLFHGPAPIAELKGLGDRYVQLQFLGEGAAGTVFKALDTLLQRWVALKVLKAESTSALSEARAQAQVEHSNVCRVYEVGLGFITMQLVEGPTLAKLTPSPDLRTKISYLRDIASGVHAAHQRGLLHLDLKLNNILMQDNGDGTSTPVLTDFGMVVTSSGERPDSCPMGTPPYSSPEQLANDFARIGPATDVYALGAMAYILLSGRSPFAATKLEDLLAAMAQAEPVPLQQNMPGIPADLARLIHKCLQKDPSLRCENPGELALELDRFLHLRPLKVMGGSLPYRALRCAQRNRLTTWAALLGIVALGLTLGVGWWREARTAQRMEWDRHFQKRVEEARVIMERAYRQPPHDLRPEIAQVKVIEDSIGTEMHRHGHLLEGPAHLALGQLAVINEARYEDAARHFTAAWEAGFRTEGTRTWLAFSLLRKCREALMNPWRPQAAGADTSMESLRQRYLEPARQMLRGRGDADQAKLGHMIDVLESNLNRPDFNAMLVRLLDLATTNRHKSPQDLDAILEELHARFLQVRTELSDEDHRTPNALILEHWKSYLALLEEGRSIGPSLPGIHANLASAAELALDYPLLDPAPQRQRMARLKACVHQALLVSPDHPKLLALKLNVLVRQLLDDEIPMDRFKAEVRTLLRSPATATDETLNNFISLAPSGAWRGQDLLPFCLEVLTAQGDIARRPTGWLYVTLLCQYYSLQGRDPNAVVRAVGMETKPPFPWRLSMIEAEHLLRAGRASEIDLGKLNAGYAQEFASGETSILVSLQAAKVNAQARGGSLDWEALERAFLEATELAKASNSYISSQPVWFECGWLLAEHAGQQGKDRGRYLGPISDAIRGSRGTDPVDQAGRAILEARTWLVRDRVGRGSVTGLREALAGLDRILDRRGLGIPFKDLVRFGLSTPGRGPLLALRAELRIHLARSLRGDARHAEAQKAVRDVAEALRLCPDYLPRLSPLKEEALHLAQS
jgi:hypothetical protein